MTRNRIQKGLVLLGLAAAALVTFVVALYVYVVATTRPLHPDVQSVPSVSRAAPQAKWTEAVERSRDIMRAGLTEQNLPGLSVAVGLDGDIVWAEGFGYADLEKRPSRRRRNSGSATYPTPSPPPPSDCCWRNSASTSTPMFRSTCLSSRRSSGR
jgi:hypothetical protein